MAAERQPDELGRVARTLYGLPPEEFTAARTDAVKQARSSGDRALATAVGALRRPAVAAWAVNLLVRERAGLLDQVTSMGDSLREAQAALDGAALRDLNRQRRRLVAAVAAEVAAVAAEHAHPLSAAASRQVEETLQAALVDPRAAAAVRSGVLVQPLASTGVESLAEVLGVPLPVEEAPVASPSGAAPSAAAPSAAAPSGDGDRDGGDAPGRPALTLVTEDEQTARRAAQERAAAAAKAARKAAKAARKAAGARDDAVAARTKAQAKVLQLEAEVEELRRLLGEAEARAEAAERRLADREEAADAAEAEAAEAAERAERAAAAEAAAREAQAAEGPDT